MDDTTLVPEWTPELEFALELYLPYTMLYVHPGNGVAKLLVTEMCFLANPFEDGQLQTRPEALIRWRGTSVKRVLREIDQMVEDGILGADGPAKHKQVGTFQFLFHHDAVATMDYWVKHEIDWRKVKPECRWGREGKSPKPAPVSSGNGLRFRVFERDGFKCVYCGAAAADGAILQADHVFPASKGGPATMDNLVTACQPCNIGKRDRVIEVTP